MEFIYLQLRKANRWMDDETRERQLLTHAVTCTTEILFCLKRYLSEKKEREVNQHPWILEFILKKKKVQHTARCSMHQPSSHHHFHKDLHKKVGVTISFVDFSFSFSSFSPTFLPPSHHISLNHSAVNCHLWRELISTSLLNGCYIPPVDPRQCNMKQAGLALWGARRALCFGVRRTAWTRKWEKVLAVLFACTDK